MPQQRLVSQVLAELLGALSHPRRIRIIEELRHGEERDVNALQDVLQISHAGVSQHLAVLRAHQVVAERREGRHVFYRLRATPLARWLADGLRFIEEAPQLEDEVRRAAAAVRPLWTEDRPPP